MSDAGPRGAVGACPRCNSRNIEWDVKSDVCLCTSCGWSNGEPRYTIKDSGVRIPMGETGFVRDNRAGKGRMDLLPWNAILGLSRYCEAGAEKYGERNIDLGAPLHSLLDSGARHLAKAMLGRTDEDHLLAACWNLMWAVEQRTTHPECNDMPWAKDGKI